MKRTITATSLAAALALVGIAWLVPAAAFASGGGGCGGPVTERAGTRVAIRRFCFTPTILRVEPGQEVLFANRDPVDHNVLGANGIWGSYESLRRDREVTYRFTDAGVYPFVCVYHPGMVGAIVVGDGVGSGFETTTADGPVIQGAAATLELAGGALPPEDEKGVPLAFLVVAGTVTVLVGGAFVIVRRRKAAD